MQKLIEEARHLSLNLDIETINFEASRQMNRLMDQLIKDPENLDLLLQIDHLLSVLNKITEGMDLQNSQNVFYSIAKKIYPKIAAKAETQNSNAQQWVEHFRDLAQNLDLKIPD